MKTTLFHALKDADYTTLDEYQVERVIFHNRANSVRLITPEHDEDEPVFFADQEIQVDSTGQAMACDVKDSPYSFCFIAKVPWKPTEKVEA